MTAVSFTTSALEGDAVEHAGIVEPTLSALIAEASAALLAFEELPDEEGAAYDAANLLRRKTRDAVADYEPTTHAEAQRRLYALVELEYDASCAAQLWVEDYERLGPLGSTSQLSPAVATALAAHETALAAHNAAIAAYTAVERRVFAKEIAKDDPIYALVDDAQEDACHLDARAWADLMETPAETEADIYAKLVVYLKGEVAQPNPHAVVFPEGGQIDDHAARARLFADMERIGSPTPPVHPDQDVIDAAQAYVEAREAFVAGYKAHQDADTSPEVKRLSDLEQAAHARLVKLRACTPDGITALARALRAFAPDGDMAVIPDDIVTAIIESAGQTRRGSPSTMYCPVAALIPEYERLANAELEEADNLPPGALAADGGPSDVRDAMALRIASMTARSVSGAALHAAIAIEFSDLARGCERQADRDRYQEHCENMLKSVLGVIGDALPDDLWSFHVGSARPPLPRRAREDAGVRAHWEAARDAYLAALAAYNALYQPGADVDISDEAVAPLYNARCDALEAFEATPPPNLHALVEMMCISLEDGGSLHWAYNKPHCPMTMRDMLDSGDAGDIFTARYFMHVMRLAGFNSPALSTPPIAGLYPSFDSSVEDEPEAMQAAWREHHATAEPYPTRADDLVRWMRLHKLGDDFGTAPPPIAPSTFDPATTIAELAEIGCRVWSLGFSFDNGMTMDIVRALQALSSGQKEACMAFAARTEALGKAFPEPAQEG